MVVVQNVVGRCNHLMSFIKIVHPAFGSQPYSLLFCTTLIRDHLPVPASVRRQEVGFLGPLSNHHLRGRPSTVLSLLQLEKVDQDLWVFLFCPFDP